MCGHERFQTEIVRFASIKLHVRFTSTRFDRCMICLRQPQPQHLPPQTKTVEQEVLVEELGWIGCAKDAYPTPSQFLRSSNDKSDKMLDPYDLRLDIEKYRFFRKPDGFF